VYLFEVIEDMEEDSTFNKPVLNKYNNNPHTIRPDPLKLSKLSTLSLCNRYEQAQRWQSHLEEVHCQASN
jgi:hypothetical protein